jgi:hypothetical protein
MQRCAISHHIDRLASVRQDSAAQSEVDLALRLHTDGVPFLLWSVCGVQLAFGCVEPARANLNPGQLQWIFMRDLGYPEPNWKLLPLGDPTENAIVVNSATQIWSDVVLFVPAAL